MKFTTSPDLHDPPEHRLCATLHHTRLLVYTHALVRSLDVGELNVAVPPFGDRRSCLLVEFGFPRGVRVLVLHPLLPKQARATLQEMRP